MPLTAREAQQRYLCWLAAGQANKRALRSSPALLALTALLSACGGGGGGNGGGSPPPPPSPTVSITVSPANIAPGGSATLSWTSTNATACTASGAWDGSEATSGSVVETPTAAGTQTYMLSCSGASGSADSATTLTVTAPNASFSGQVLGGGAPVTGATVSIFSAGSAAMLGSAVSDADGRFSFGFFNPGGATVLYATAAGGNAGAGVNAAIKLSALLGRAADFSSSSSFVVNELTTVASTWALAQFLDAGGAVNGGGTSLAVAAASAANLANVGTGAAASAVQAGANTPDKLNSLANLLAACIASSDATSAPCAGLFANTTASGGGAPADTLAAALVIALHPAANAAALYTLAGGSTAYGPALTSAPGDWTLSLNYSGGGLSEPTQVALDANGNAWVANYNGAVTELSPAGAALSPSAGYTGGGLEESFGIAVDAVGHVWVSNEQSPSGVNAGLGSITELAPNGSILSGSGGYAGGGLDFPDAVAIDAAGNVWAGNYGNSTLSKFSSSGAALSPAAGFGGGGLSFPTALAFDAAGTLWIADNGANQISAFSAAGAALSPAGGYSGGGIQGPQALALDQHGNVWIANYYGDSVSELDAHGNPLSPAGAYSGGGLATPGGVAIDGKGAVWISNYNGASISELAGADAASPGAALSPAGGFTGTGLLQPFSPAIDSAGNLWTANFGNDSVTEFIGMAAPVRLPLLGVPQSP